ncbi:MAG: HAMP domain-containing sensor histidine kinase [Candidatus Limnocylindrales bacterium]
MAYIMMFATVMGVFSVSFLVLIAVVLQPDFDLAPETSSDQAALLAYDAAVERIGLSLVAADVVAISIVGIGAWVLAARTLRPIRQAHERQRRFVADASHEMRTPLTAIRATTENAMSTEATPMEQRAALETVAVAAADLATLTSDLLTLAQSDDAAAQANSQRFDLSVVVAERFTLRAAADLPAPKTTLFGTDLVVDGSPEEVGRIFDNLIDNAFRYGGPRVHVTVTTRAADRQALLEVADDGPGIALGDQVHIFEPFFRVRADASAPPGTGLGLAIATALARRNRGRLTITSQPARGSVFRLSLPLVG